MGNSPKWASALPLPEVKKMLQTAQFPLSNYTRDES